MKKLLGILVLGLLWCNVGFAADVNLKEPLWDQVSELTCKGKYRFECTNGNCNKYKSKAIWKIDFKNNLVDYLNMNFEEKIDHKHHKYFDHGAASNTIYFGSRLMVFEIDNIKNFSSSIPSVVLGASNNIINHDDMDVTSTHYECFSSE
jgi:hypothetical protein